MPAASDNVRVAMADAIATNGLSAGTTSESRVWANMGSSITTAATRNSTRTVHRK
jgi:hypothetical protein